MDNLISFAKIKAKHIHVVNNIPSVVVMGETKLILFHLRQFLFFFHFHIQALLKN